MFDDTQVDEWSKSDFDKYASEDVPIGAVGWQFVEKFTGRKGKDVYLDGKVIEVSSGSKPTYECKYSDGDFLMRTMTQLQRLAKNKYGHMEHGEGDGDDYYPESEEEESEEDDDEPEDDTTAKPS